MRESLDQAWHSSQRYVWAICYRMTGNAADADDILAETFTRAVERPPKRTDLPWRPWLVRVAVNLAKDLLRKRRRRQYTGPWLPSPIDTGEEPAAFEPTLPSGETTEGRYDLLESVSFAFLLALEQLRPQQRAVLLLRDVFDYSVRETAAVLDISEANVKTTLHRARRVMRDYDTARLPRTDALTKQTRDVMIRFLQALAARDVATIESLLADDVRVLGDGAGVYLSALNPICGRDKTVRFYLGLLKRTKATRIVTRDINGAPGVVMELDSQHERDAPLAVMSVELNAAGKIREIRTVMAPRKLTAMRLPH